MKKWLKKKWDRVKKWFWGLFIALGLAVPLVFGAQDFTYTPATTYEDGSPLPLGDIIETRLYCDSDPTPKAVEAGADGDFTGVVFTPGNHTCFATHVANTQVGPLESGPSVEVTFVVRPDVPPNPPQNFSLN